MIGPRRPAEAAQRLRTHAPTTVLPLCLLGSACELCLLGNVTYTVARERGEVGPTPGITVIAAPGAAAAAVMPGVCPGYFHICT